jgi:hypothetical protein
MDKSAASVATRVRGADRSGVLNPLWVVTRDQKLKLAPSPGRKGSWLILLLVTRSM